MGINENLENVFENQFKYYYYLWHKQTKKNLIKFYFLY